MARYAYASLVLCFIALGCKDKDDFSTTPPTDTKQTNQVREKIGIRRIKDNWTFYGRQFSTEKWSNNSKNLCKIVMRAQDGNEVLWEEDYYYSGATYVDPNNGGTVWEFLTIHYDYCAERFYIGYTGINPAIMSLLKKLENTSHGLMGETNESTIFAADSVLEKWGLKRL